MSDRITISDSSHWPPQVSAISQYLTNELPPSLLSSHPTLSPRASHLWTEVTTRYPPSTSYQGLPHELVDVMDTLLSTVSTIRTLRGSNATSRETRPFVSLLLYVILRFCYPEAHVRENVRFARSYLDKLGNMTVGDARMLASVVSPSSYDLDDDTISSGSASTESSSSVDSAYYEDSDNCSEHSRSTDGSTPSQSESVESIPRDAHVYDFWPDRHSVAFPFVCVADEDSVVDILRSTVFQRATWALKDPVIGIALSEKDFLARVHFAWADQDPLERAPIHITTSDDQASLGVFDLTAPDSALCLSLFLLSLRPLYDIFAEQCRTALYNDVQWRADSFIDDMNCLPESWEDTISTWLHHVQSDMTTLKPSEVLPLSPLDSSGSCNKIPPVVSCSSLDTTSRGRNSCSPASSRNRSPAPKSVPAEDISQLGGENSIVPQVNIESDRPEQKPSDKTGRAPAAVLNCYSPPELYPPSEQELSSDDCLDIGSFLDDRNVIQIACVRLEDYVLQYAEEANSLLDTTHSTATEINGMVDLYNDLTEYRHLPNDFYAHIDPALFPLYELFKSPKKAFDDGAAGGKAICDAAALDLDLVPLVCESISLLLWNVARAKGFKRSINTSGAHQCWDFVIAMSFVSFGETVSRRVIMERKLPAARNAVADCVMNEKDLSDTLHEASLNRARLCYELYQAAAIHAPLLSDHTPEEWNVRNLVRSLGGAFSRSLTRHRNIKEKQTAESSDTILKRAKEEINNSRCDSVAVFPAVGLKQPVLYPFVELAKDPVTTPLPFPAELAARQEHDLGGCPLLPVFLGQFGKENETPSKAIHQSKLHLVSAVVFLASLGFKKHPVYAVVTEGTFGVVLCCWHSAESDTIFLMDRNVRRFDISSPIQMYQFATFMMRLRKWSDQKLEQSVRAHVAMPEQDKWTKDAQNGELFPDWKEMATEKEKRTKRENTF